MRLQSDLLIAQPPARSSPDSDGMPDAKICFSVRFRGTPTEVRRVLRVIRCEVNASGADADMLGRIETLLAEVLNNVVEHALCDKGDQLVEVGGEQHIDGWHFRVSDCGRGLPQGELPGKEFPTLDRDTQDLPEGGFGWAMVHLLTRDLVYRRMSGRNCLSFVIPLE